jgi:hypothetical protein
MRYLDRNQSVTSRYSYSKLFWFSVRCIKD